MLNPVAATGACTAKPTAALQGKENVRTFVHVPCEVGATEAEEVGVEHLLRDINDPSVSNLAADLRAKLGGLRGLSARLYDVSAYLGAVLEGRLPINNDILYHVQSMLSQLPNVRVEAVQRSLASATNDQHLLLYIASLGRAGLALHDLVNNKAKYRDEEERDGKKKEGAEAGPDGTAAGKPQESGAAAAGGSKPGGSGGSSDGASGSGSGSGGNRG